MATGDAGSSVGGVPRQRRAGGIERHVAPADDDDTITEVGSEALVHVEQELDGPQHTVEIVAG